MECRQDIFGDVFYPEKCSKEGTDKMKNEKMTNDQRRNRLEETLLGLIEHETKKIQQDPGSCFPSELEMIAKLSNVLLISLTTY